MATGISGSHGIHLYFLVVLLEGVDKLAEIELEGGIVFILFGLIDGVSELLMMRNAVADEEFVVSGDL